jgi:hypothetical protein
MAIHSVVADDRSVTERIANHTYANAPRDVLAIETKPCAGVGAISECPLQGIPLVRRNNFVYYAGICSQTTKESFAHADEVVLNVRRDYEHVYNNL